MSAFLVSSPNPTQLLSNNLICPNQSSLFCNLKGARRNLLFQSSVSPLMHNSHLICRCRHPLRVSAQRPDSDVSPFPTPSPTPSTAALGKVFHGQCFVVDGNIDTDQIIPAEYLTLVPSKPDEYEKLGSYAMVGLPVRYGCFIEEGQTKTRYPIIIAGANFGCGSSREHAPVALGAAGVRAIVAESYARIFFRNSVATGELYPVESESTVWTECKTGDYVTVDLINNVLVNHTQNSKFALKPIGDAGPVIDAGGIFAYARKTGMIASQAA